MRISAYSIPVIRTGATNPESPYQLARSICFAYINIIISCRGQCKDTRTRIEIDRTPEVTNRINVPVIVSSHAITVACC
ncbi:hypothetical protein DSECCO2_453420 [anaerobic digester metagenome]